MLNKKALSVAIAAASVSMGASALVDMDATNPVVVTYAAETLSSASTVTGSGNPDGQGLTGTFYQVTDAGTDLDIQAELGVGVSSGNQLFIRFDLTNAVLGTNVIAALDVTVSGAGATSAVSLGGAVGDDYVIFSLTALGDLATTDTIRWDLALLGVASSGSSNVNYAAYETLTAARLQDQSLYTNSVPGYVSVAPGASASFSPNLNTAEVTTEFMEFTAGSLSATLANIGELVYAASAGVFAADDGLAVTLGDVANEAATTVTLSGDFGFGSWFLSANTNCSTTDVDLSTSIENSSGVEAEAALTEFGSNGFTQLCVNVDGTMDVINEGSYVASADVLAANVSVVVPPSNISGVVGTIDRNGTVVQAPYITTFEDYNQRIILVNRGNSAAPYTTSFTPEAGVTATAGSEAMGTLQPGETRVIRAADFVTIEGGTRTAATISIVAPPNSIDAATTQVNLADGGTDTVVLF